MADPNSISIDTTTPEYAQVSIDNPLQPTALKSLTPDGVEERSSIAALGLAGTVGLTKPQIADALANGQEDQLRMYAAGKINDTKINWAKKMIADHGSELSDQTLQTMLKAQDPKSVFEEHYAKAYMNFLDWPKNDDDNRDNWVYTTALNHPQEWEYLKNVGEDHLAKHSILGTKYQDTYGSSSWKDTLATTAKDVATLGWYSDIKMRAGTGVSDGVLLGSNLEQQRKDLWALPVDEFKKTVDDTVANMTPDVGASWVKAMVGQSTADLYVNNISTGLNTAATAQIAYAPLKSVTKAAVTEVSASSAYRRMTGAVADMLTPRPMGLDPNVSGPTLAGNISQAAINKVAIDNINELNPTYNPVKSLIGYMTGNYDVLGQGIANNPGNLSREAAIRLVNLVSNDKERFISTVMNNMLARGDRTPTAEMREQIAIIQQKFAEMYRTPDNQVLNVSKGIYIPGLNVRLYNVAVGTNDARFFNSEKEAIANSRKAGWAVYGDYNVSPEEFKKLKSIENLIGATKVHLAEAATPEGRANAQRLLNEYQKILDDAPKHTTGVVIGRQEMQGPALSQYTAPIGPTMPNRPLSRIQRLAQQTETSTVGDQIAAALNKKLEPETGAIPTSEEIAERLKGIDTPTVKSPISPEETFEQWLSRVQEDIPQTRSKKKGTGNVSRLGGKFISKDALSTYEALDTGNLSEAKQAVEDSKWWAGLTPAQQKLYEETGSITQPRKPRLNNAISTGFPGLPAEIRQQGGGYYIMHSVYLPEEMNFVRDGLIKAAFQTPAEFREAIGLSKVSTSIPNDWAGGWINAILGRVRSPAERLSIAENLNRVIATHGPSVLLGMYEDGKTPLELIPRAHHADFNRMTKYLQNEGKWFNDPAELNEFYVRVNGRPASELEQRAYFAYRALMLDDLHMRNIAVMQHKIVMGAKQHAVNYIDNNGNKTTTPFFEGVEQERFPNHGTVLVINADTPKSNTFNLAGRMGSRQIMQDVAEGKAKLIRLLDSSEKPFKSIENRPVEYVVSYSNQEKPIGFDHVNQQGGGHRIPKWGFFLKQADVNTTRIPRTTVPEDTVPGEQGHSVSTTFARWLETPVGEPLYDVYNRYNGDKTLLSFRTQAEAEEAIPFLDRVRTLLEKHLKARETPRGATDLEDIARWEGEGGATGPQTLAERYYQLAAEEAGRTGLPFSKLTDIWLGKNGAPPAFDVSQPIRVVPSGGKIIDLDKTLENAYPEGLRDATRESSLLSKAMVAFTQERDAEGLYTLRSIGTESNPQFAYESAPLLQPVTALERGYQGIINTMFMYDMKKFSIEHWLEQAKNWLDATEADIRNNPISIFYNPVYKRDIPPQIQANLESNRLMAGDFVGIGDPTSVGIQSIGQAMSDALYNKGKITVKPLYDLPKEKDYLQWMRNVAFYSSQISLKTFFTQASTLSNIYFIAGPKNASKATAAMMQYGYWKMFSGRPEVLEGIDRSLSRYFGWSPGKFTEAVQFMEGAGMNHIGGDHVFKAGMTAPGLQFENDVTPFSLAWRTVSNFGRTVLDYGSIPFNLGAGTTRISAFFTAYLETLEKAPGGVIDRTLRDNMLGRASLLDANMSTAFNSRLNKGLFSIPFQFESYDQRMGELMWGKQLTRNEKLALFTSSSMMFGLRGGFYASLGIPAANYVLGKTETAMGYVPGENPLYDMVVNGFPSWMFAMLSGFTDPDGKKTWIDFSKWGNRGIQPLEDFFDTDKTAADIALGAFGGVFGQAWQNSWGMRKALWDKITADKDSQYRMTSDDVFQVLKTQSLIGDINKTWLAFHTGKLFTRNDVYVTDIGKVHSLIAGITGLGPIAASDVWIKQKELSNNEAEIKKVQAHINAEVARAALDGANGDESNHNAHMKNVAVLIKLIPPEKWNQTIKEAFRNTGKSLEDRVNQKLYMNLMNDPAMLSAVNRSK